MKLYIIPGACSLAVNISLREAGVRFELARVDLETGAAGQFTIADAYLFTVLGWGKEVGLDMNRWPRLQSYRAHIALRPHVVAALESEA